MNNDVKLCSGHMHDGARPFLYGFGAAIAGIFFAATYFEDFLEIAATGLIALSLTVVVNSYLEQNRDAIWNKKESPAEANTLITLRIAGLFFGIFAAALLLQTFAPDYFLIPETDLDEAYRNQFKELLLFNLTVFFGGAIFSIFYRAGGLVTILAWNAMHWSNAILNYIREISETAGMLAACLTSLALIPHLVTEVIAYVIAGMVGIFLSKALFKYNVFSDQFLQVARACVFLLLIALAILTCSVSLEIYLAQSVFHAF